MRTEAAEGFDRDAAAYERGRPDTPQEAVDRLVAETGIAAGRDVCDLGAGTGKLTRRLVPTGASLVAIDPVAAMRAQFSALLPDVPVVDGTAEAMPLPDASQDAVVVAQAFHWFDGPVALAEIARVLRPAGALGLIWNVRDEDTPWQAEISAAMDRHRGDVPAAREGAWRSAFEDSAPFGPLGQATFSFVVPATPAVLRDRVASVSFVALLPDAERDALLDDVSTIAAPHVETDGTLPMPYRTEVYWTIRR